jgi:hypothetical protein
MMHFHVTLMVAAAFIAALLWQAVRKHQPRQKPSVLVKTAEPSKNGVRDQLLNNSGVQCVGTLGLTEASIQTHWHIHGKVNSAMIAHFIWLCPLGQPLP